VAGASAVLAFLAVESEAARRRQAAVTYAAALAAALSFGAWRLAQPVAAQGSLRVGLVQASIRQEEKWPRAGERNCSATSG